MTTNPVVDAVEKLRSFGEVYIERARSCDRDACDKWADYHSGLVDDRGDADAAGLHATLAVLYRSHVLADMAASMIAEFNHDPFGGDTDPRGEA